MKILRIVYDWPDENTITEGLAPAPYELSLAQTRLGHEIFVLCGNLNGKNLKRRIFSYDLADGKIHVYNLPRALKGFGPFLTTSVFVLPYYFYLKLIKNIDIVHNHGHLGVWLLLYKAIFGFIDKTKFIGHYHITAAGREKALDAAGQHIDMLSGIFEYPIHKLSDKLMSQVSFHLVAVSKDLVAEVIKFFQISPGKITLLESAVDSKRFIKLGNKADLGFDPEDIILGNGGRLSKRKNIDILVESLAHLPENYKLVLWGTWDEKFKLEVDEIIQKNKLESRVMYVGSVPYFEVDKYYRAVDIFVLPSSYEGLPKVVLEALACGCKVLASGFKTDKNIPGLQFLTEIESKSLAQDIQNISKEMTHYEETRKIIEESYSWDSKARILNEIMRP